MVTFPTEKMHSRSYNLGLDIQHFSNGLDDGIENIPVKPAHDAHLGGAV